MSEKIIKVMFCSEDEESVYFGITYISTRSLEFIDELFKYKCPIRAIDYLDSNVHNYNYLSYLSNIDPDIILDYSKEHKKLYESLTIPFDILTEPKKYISFTSHLDKYGNKL